MSNAITIVVGNIKTGKTTLVKQMLKASPLPKKLVVDSDLNDTWENLETYDDPDGKLIKMDLIHPDMLQYWNNGHGITSSNNTRDVIRKVDKHVYNAVVVLEDARRYCKNKLTQEIESLVLNHKQHNLQLILVFHLLSHPPKDLLELAHYVVLKKSNREFPKHLRDRYPEEFEEAFERVKNHKNPYYYETVYLKS